ncbi:mannose-1-phosphate guanylyltransferase [Candidatus Margulisiibacteriota bacterium]
MVKKIQSLAFILAGGRGTRLAPLSLTTEGSFPKQFLALAKRRTMLQEAINRVPKGIPMVVVPEERYKDEVVKQSEGAVEVISEPFGCNTTAAVGLAAVYALHKGYSEKTVIFIMPADHYMDTRCFRKYYDVAIQGAANGKIVTIGITPDRPATGYGYIKANRKMQTIFGKQALYETEAFVEKPDLDTAKKYVESKEYFWNSGIFAMPVAKILNVLEKHSPVVFKAVQNIKEALGTPQQLEILTKEYQAIKDAKQDISIDYSVMEKEAKNMFLLPAEVKLDWNDVGGWVALEKYIKPDAANNRALNKVEFTKCKDVFALNYRHEHLLWVAHLEDLLIVDTDNGLLVCPKEFAQRAKEIIPGLEQGQKEILIESEKNEISNQTEIPIACLGCKEIKIDYSAEKLVVSRVGIALEEPKVEEPVVEEQKPAEEKADEKPEEVIEKEEVPTEKPAEAVSEPETAKPEA